MMTDVELLRAYAEEGSEAAFGELVGRQVNLVYAVARRQCGGDAALAEDVTQRVFTDLARKARALTGHALLGGWLYRSTRYAAADVVRAERRRRAREEEAQAMHAISQPTITEDDWKNLAPLLDAAVGALGERDREAVVARFFEGKSFGEIGAALRVTEDAARMRVDRALDRLRTGLVRRGVTSTSAALGIALAHQAAGAAAPAGLAASLSAAALASAAELGAAGAWAGFLAMSKLQMGIAGVLAAAGLAVLTVQLNTRRALAGELAQVREESRLLAALPPAVMPVGQGIATPQPRPTAAPPRGASAPARSSSDDDQEARLAALRIAGMKPTSEWQNGGRATPHAAFETMLWAWRERDYDVLATLINFTPEGKVALDAWFAGLPESTRAKFATAERAIAPAFAERTAPISRMTSMFHAEGRRYELGYKFVPVPPDPRMAPDAGRLAVLYSFTPDAARPETVHMVQTDGGWKFGRMADTTVPFFAERIDPATGELLPPVTVTPPSRR